MHDHISDQQLVETLARLNRYADLTDSRFRIPGTNIRFGLDSIVGFIPILGEAFGLIMAFYLIYEAYKLGVPAAIKLKMFRNAILDVLIGLIPIIGDFADVAFKANLLNMKLLVEHIDEEVQRRNAPLETVSRNKMMMLCLLVAGCALAAALALLSYYYLFT